MNEENKKLETKKRSEVKISVKGFIGLGIIMISLFILNSFVSNPPHEDEAWAIILGLLSPLFLILLIGIILFFFGSKGYDRKLILILITLPFILRILIGVQILHLPVDITRIISGTEEIEKIKEEAITTKNPGKCFFEIKEIPLISYFFFPPIAEIKYVSYNLAPITQRCITDIAIAKQDVSICSLLEEKRFILYINASDEITKIGSADRRAECFLEASLFSKKYGESAQRCKELFQGNSYDEEMCMEYFAIKENNIEMCENLPYKYPCIAAVDMANRIPDNDTAKCKETIEKIGKDHSVWSEGNCLRALAIRTGDIKICEKLTVNQKGECKYYIEKITK